MPIEEIFAVARLLPSTRRHERLTIILCWAAIALAALLLGYMHYVVGLLSYTAAGYFPDLSKLHSRFTAAG